MDNKMGNKWNKKDAPVLICLARTIVGSTVKEKWLEASQ